MSNTSRAITVVLDAALQDSHLIREAMPAGTRVVQIPHGVDGLPWLARRLADAPEVGALHIFAHGAPGRMALGTAEVSAASARGAHEAALQRIGAALAPGGEVLIYACRFGAGAAGRAAVGTLSRAMGAPVAAPSRPVGPAHLGGSWDLDVGAARGAMAVPDYPHLLLTLTFTVTAGQTITIPTQAGGGSYDVNWGDGTTVTGLTGGATHTFASAGTFTVTFSGDYAGPVFLSASAATRDALSSIESWGALNYTSFSNAFFGLGDIIYNATDAPDLSGVTSLNSMFEGTRFSADLSNWTTTTILDMSDMFMGNTTFNGDVSTWDTSNVTNMFRMFYEARSFDQDISGWDTSSAVNMSNMFMRANVFNQDIGGWTTTSVTNMNGMFREALLFNQDISGWNTANVTDMGNMFRGASAFDQNIGGWTTSSVIDMNNMFANATSFNQDISGWNTASVENMSLMFDNADAFDQNIGSWNTANVTNMAGMFRNADLFNQDISGWNTASVMNMSSMFENADAFNQDISGWNTANVTSMFRMFLNNNAFNQNIGGWDTSSVMNMSSMFLGASVFDGDISGWDTSSVTDMSSMFHNARVFNQDIGGWDTSSVTNMSFMFRDADSFNQDIGGWDTSSVTNMTNMFAWNESFNQNIGGWDTSSVTNMSSMFYGANAFDQDIGGWNTANVTTMSGMFLGARSFNQDIGLWNTSSVTTMSGMFQGADAFNQDIGGWDTSSVTNMSGMFFNADSFNQNIGGWNTANVTNMGDMFRGASAFNQDIGGWDTSSVTNMGNMFLGAGVFNQNIGGWDTSSVTNMSFMFRDADVFNQDIGGWDTSSVTNMTNMFAWNESFNQDISLWDTSSVTNMSNMFWNATSFDQDLGGWDLSSVSDMSGMFSNSGMSTENYDSTINGWFQQLELGLAPSGLDLGANGLLFSPASADARAAMIDDYGWSFSGDSFDTDADGVNTENDLDDDNDGILDVDEDDATRIDAPSGLTHAFVHDNVANQVTVAGTTATAGAGGFEFGVGDNNASVGDTVSITFDQSVFNVTLEFTGSAVGASIGNVTVTFEGDAGPTTTTFALGSSGTINFESVSPTERILSITFEVTGTSSASPDAVVTFVPTIVGVDTDRDGIRDSRDIDSDNDGILDIVEAQTTAGFTGTTGTYTNGVDDGFAGGITPVDTDGDGIADFRDSDSDDDGIADIAERGDGAPTSVTDTTDTDRDGLLDIFEGADVTDINASDEQVDGAGNITLAGDTRLAPDGSNATPMTLDLEFRDVNDAPEGTDGTITADEETPYTFSASDFGFTDPNEPTPDGFASVTITTLPVNGVLELSGVPVTAGQVIDAADFANLTYTGATDVFGPGADSFTFQVSDDGGTAGPASGNPAEDTDQSPNTLTIDLNNVNDIIDDDEVILGTRNLPITGNVLANATSETADPLAVQDFSIAGETGPFVLGTPYTITGVGTLDLASDGAFTFTPETDWFGVVPTITYTVTDNVVSTDSSTLDMVVCFTAGTLILTEVGYVPIERLRIGDMVQTADAGLQPIRYIGDHWVSRAEMRANQRLAPIRIAKDALGPSMPFEDLWVSRQHRILLANEIVPRMFGCDEVLAAAIHLTGLQGVDVSSEPASVRYLHLLFDAHHVICANGAAAESLFMGEMARNIMRLSEAEHRLQVNLSVHPILSRAATRPGRPFAPPKRARKLCRRMIKNCVPAVEEPPPVTMPPRWHPPMRLQAIPAMRQMALC